MADLADNTNWFELDSSNSTPPPNGWPEGQAPSTVNDCARANMGALKRFWNKLMSANAVTPAGGTYTLTTSNTAFPTAYADGEMYKIRPASNSVGNDQFQINALGTKPILKETRSGAVAIAAGDMIANQPAYLVYNASLNTGSGAFVLANPYLPILQDNAGGIAVSGTVSANALSTSGSLTVTGGISAGNTISSTGTNAALSFQDRSGVDTWLWYATGDVARLWNGNQGGDRIWVTSNAHLNFAGPSGYQIYDDGNSHIESNNTLWLNANTHAQVVAGGPMSVGSSGITYSGIGSGHYHAFSWDGTAVHNWVDGSDQGQVASRSWVSGNFATSAALGGYLPLSGGTLSGALTVNGYTNVADFNTRANCQVAGWVIAGTYVQANATGTAVYAPNGNVVCQSLVQSDRRLKTDIVDSGVGLDAILALAPKTFRRLARPDEEELGLIAQDVAAVLPHAVSTCELAEDANLGIYYSAITTALIGAVKELAAEVAELKRARGE